MPPGSASILQKHVRDAKKATSHDGKRTVFTRLLKELFSVELGELLPGIEAKLGSKIYGVKGSADLLFSNVAFEFKRDLRNERELTDAVKNKLPKYLQALHEAEPERKHIGIATDAIQFKAYSPMVKGDKVINLKTVGELDLEKVTSEEVTLWLDSFLFSQTTVAPTAEDIKWRFGPGSPTYALSVEELEAIWKTVKSYEDTKLRLDLWAKHMEMVYGSKPDPKAFIDQTYLITLVKLILYLKLSEAKIVRKEEIKRVITGEYFRGFGVLNLIEEDFFMWPMLYPEIRERAIDLACLIAKELLRYNMDQVDEDLFKEIYQEIISRSERHKVGEYYTPEWLCELTLREALKEWKREHKSIPRILDPACGSGTFLTNAIKLLRKELKAGGNTSQEAAKLIFRNVVGIDINPLAVTIARANYILMFGDELPSFHVTIPVYIADSIKLPPEIRTEIKGVEAYTVRTNRHQLRIPVRIASDRETLGLVLQGMDKALETYRSKKSKKGAQAVLERWAKGVLPEEFEILSSTLETLMELVNEGEDSIWTFWINNIYAPVALKETPFDLIVGNPPWVAMRYFEDINYQNFLKKSVLQYQLLDKEEVELFTHMEIATLFFRKAGDLYLRDGGIIGFVMPRSVLTGALHHVKFKHFEKPLMRLTKIIDLEEVSPLFKVPSCVLRCTKGQETSYPIPTIKYHGKLEKKNARFSDAMKVLEPSKYGYQLPMISVELFSPYRDKVKEGATIFPRALWFVEFDVPPTGWVDLKAPAIKTSSDVQKKPPWKVDLKGNVESDFIYVTLLGEDIVRFGHRKLRPVILPIVPLNEKYSLLDIEELAGKGFTGITEWLEKSQRIWEQKATDRSIKSCPRILSWINYRNKLRNQNPKAKYVVLYNTSGANLFSCIMNKQKLPPLEIGSRTKTPIGFVTESQNYSYETNNEDEAQYLCAILNSNALNNAIKPYQTRGTFGPRHIHRRPFMFPIPRFDKNNPNHMRLAELSKICHAKVSSLHLKELKPASARKTAAKIVEEELGEINNIVKKIIPQLS